VQREDKEFMTRLKKNNEKKISEVQSAKKERTNGLK
jgi:hypothetical protein